MFAQIRHRARRTDSAPQSAFPCSSNSILADRIFCGQNWSIKAADNAFRTISINALFWMCAVKQLAPHAVDGLALLVHHVVVFEDVFARGESAGLPPTSERKRCAYVIRFDSIGTSSSMPRRSIRFCMRSPPKMRRRSSCKRKEEARTARIALSSGAAPQLVIDTAGFVAFGA